MKLSFNYRVQLEDIMRHPIEWVVKPVQSEQMRLVELLRRVGEKRVPDVEPAIR